MEIIPVVSAGSRRNRQKVIDGFNCAAEMLRGFEMSGCEIFGFTMGQFSLMELIQAVIERIGKCDMGVSVWTAAEADLRDAYTLLDCGYLKSVRMVVDRSFESRQPDYCNTLRALFGDCVAIARTHAKFAVLSNESYSIAIRTSMNLNRNTRWEQFEISDCPLLSKFLWSVLNEPFKSGSSIGSSESVVTEATRSIFA